VDTNQDSDKARINFNGGIDDDGTSFVVVTDEDEANKALSGDGKQFFRGDVDFGELFEANDNTDSFGSKTFIHFFDDANGGLLQTIEYHTSCSQPIQLGDVIGNATLFGYDGEDAPLVTIPQDTSEGSNNSGDTGSNTILLEVDNPFDPNNIGEDADTPTGPLAQKGDIVTWTYQATNTGNVDLTILDLVDDNDTPNDPDDDFTPEEVLVNGFNFGDTNQDGIFNPNETWYFQAKEVAQETGQFKNTAVITAEGIGEIVTDMDMSHRVVNPLDIEKLVAVEPMVEQGSACDTAGKPEELSFTYLPSLIIDTNQKPGQVEFQNTPLLDNPGDEEVYIVTNKGFSGTVSIGEEFTFAATGGDLEFEIYDFQGGPLLQEISKYHLSCSQPITLGDVLGSVTLTGYKGENGTVTIPEPEFVDADEPTGPQAIVNSNVDFKFVVNNTGDSPLSNVVVIDDNKTPGDPSDDFEPTFEGGDDNHDGLLDVGETWYYSSSESAELGQQTNKATVTADFGDLELMDMDTANYEGIITPPPSGDICETLGKPEAMTFTYEPGTDVLTGQDPSKAGVLTQNGTDADGISFVVVTDEDDITKVLNGEGRRFFEGDVAFEQSFQAMENFNNNGDTFGSETFVHFFEDQNGGLLQSINYHTSCSQPIQINDVIGNATLKEYFGELGEYDDPTIVPVNTVM
ncbi:MAG TPA: hypothetical protein DCF68_13005, partial [Cyanothece sp. UBA12306]|nr:hypothetical protein [Cyanothece sp. UBA12306]